MKILAIETSCDETAVSLINNEHILANDMHSQVALHRQYGGVVPEIAARSHVETIPLMIEKSLKKSKLNLKDLDAIAVTGGPGLITGVMVGVMYAKSIAISLNKQFIAINHLEGHALSIFLKKSTIKYPYLLLLVSGGHCQIIIVTTLGHYQILGNTIDDAAGEAFDKVAKMLGLPYPGGPAIEKLALQGNERFFNFPKPMLNRTGCDFSFSGLKTAVRNILLKQKVIDEQVKANICASFQYTMVEIFYHKIMRALNTFHSIHPKTQNIVIAGGVGANQYIKNKLTEKLAIFGYKLDSPPASLCTDNALMIAFVALQRLKIGNYSSIVFAPLSKWPIDEIQYPNSLKI